MIYTSYHLSFYLHLNLTLYKKKENGNKKRKRKEHQQRRKEEREEIEKRKRELDPGNEADIFIVLFTLFGNTCFLHSSLSQIYGWCGTTSHCMHSCNLVQ